MGLIVWRPRVRHPDSPLRTIHSQHQSIFVQRNKHPQRKDFNAQAHAFEDRWVMVQARVEHDDMDRKSTTFLVIDGVPATTDNTRCY